MLPPTWDLIKEAARKNPIVIKFIDQVTNSVFVKSVIEENPNSLVHVSGRFIENFPEYCTTQLANVQPSGVLGSDDVEEFASMIPENWWTDNNEFVRTWFEAGLPLVSHGQPEAWKTDRDKLLLVAQHCPRKYWKRNAFRYIPEELKDDVQFITRAMEWEPALFEFASQRLRSENYELALWALGDIEFTRSCVETIRGSRHAKPLTPTRRHECLDRAFQEWTFYTFKRAVRASTDDTPVSMLKHDDFMVTFSGFLGIPVEISREHLHKVINARRTWEKIVDELNEPAAQAERSAALEQAHRFARNNL